MPSLDPMCLDAHADKPADHDAVAAGRRRTCREEGPVDLDLDLSRVGERGGDEDLRWGGEVWQRWVAARGGVGGG